MGRKNPISTEIPEQFVRIINKYNSLQKRPLDYGCGEDLYPSEIHAIEAIGKYPEVHMAELARILGVTRGAIQQTVGRLVKKRMVEKFMDESDRKKVYLELTEKGNTAFDGHEAYHADLSSYLGEYFNRLRPRDAASLKDFFHKVESFMDAYNEQKIQGRRKLR
jgi:DNA-binding MarR family transcriptional regulator